MRTVALTALLSTLAAAPLWSQSAQYTPPGSLGREAGIPDQQQLETALQEARWRLGVVRIAPWVGLRDASLVSEQDRGEDFTATFGLGVRGYLRTGRRVIWAAHVLPEYVWWQDDPARRQVNGRAGLGLFAYLNRLTLELSRRREERQRFFSPEVQRLASTQTDTSRLALEVALSRRIALFGTAQRTAIANDEATTPELAALDRATDVVEGGLRYRSPGGWTFGLGVRQTENNFARGARNLSSSGTGELLELAYDGARFGGDLHLLFQSLDGTAGSAFGSFDETTGGVSTTWSLRRRLSLSLYGRRDLIFAIAEDSLFFLSSRRGARLDFDLRRLSLGLLGEVGDDAFEPAVQTAVRRRDDVSSYGAEMRIPLGRTLYLAAHFLNTRYRSNLPAFDRDVTLVGATIELGRLLERLRLGRPEGVW